MPLDDNEIAGIKTAMESGNIADNVELKKLSDIGMKLHTEDSLSTLVKGQVETDIKPHIAELHNQYDKDIFELTGIPKDAAEKSYEYLKRSVPLHVTTNQTDEMKRLTTENQAFKKQIEEGSDPEGIWQAKIDANESKYKTELEKRESALSDERTKTATETKSRLLAEAVAPFRADYRKDLPSYWPTTEKMILQEALDNSIVVEDDQGNQILVEKDPITGEAQKGSDFKMIPISNRLKVSLKDVVKLPVNNGGAGSGGEGAGDVDPSKITVENFVLPDNVKTKDALVTHLMSLAIDQGSDKFDELYDKHESEMKGIG